MIAHLSQSDTLSGTVSKENSGGNAVLPELRPQNRLGTLIFFQGWHDGFCQCRVSLLGSSEDHGSNAHILLQLGPEVIIFVHIVALSPKLLELQEQ